jgi:putative polyketide hydroxylase
MRGPDRLAEAVSAVFHAPLRELLPDLRYGLYAITHPDADGVLLPAGRGDRWVYGVLDEPGSPLARLPEDDLARRIRLAAGIPGLEPRIERTGRFSFAAQLAHRFRAGHTFLVGDAAHRATPRGGTGMNTAIQDGYDLGWKLAWVLRGWAAPELLDSYERERRPVAEHNVARSADSTGTTRDAGDELHVDLGNRIAHVWTVAGGERVSTLDLLGPGLTLFTGPGRGGWENRLAAPARRQASMAVRNLDAITARAMGIPPGGALLARPDGAPAEWFVPRAGAAPELRAA